MLQALLWDHWEQIEASLEGFASTPDEIRELGIEELIELVRFQDEMELTAKGLKRLLHAAANGDSAYDPKPQSDRRITSLDHPVLVKLRKKAEGFRALALKILHTNWGIN